MKNLYKKKGKVHPCPSPPPVSDNLLSLLPAAILALAAALCEEDRQILAYLISCSSGSVISNTSNSNSSDDLHDPMFDCNCFSCYMSYWVRWDTSPNREKIHDIIEAYEEGLYKKKKKSLKKKKAVLLNSNDLLKENNHDYSDNNKGIEDSREFQSSGVKNSDDDNVQVDLMENSTVRKITSFIGDKIWGIWTRD